MAVTYKGNEIQLSASNQKLNVDVVYARPEDIIKLDFDLKDVKVTFVNGDVDLIFSNGSVISLASYAALAFSNNAPKIYDGDGKVISLENLLQSVQVLKPEDAVLILANRDKYQMVQNDKDVNKIITATEQSGELQGGNPIAGIGELSTPTSGISNPIIDKTGIVAVNNLKNGLGDYLNNNYKTNSKGSTDTDNILPGNTNVSPQPSLIYNFLFGDSGVRGQNKNINGQSANYYAVQFGSGDAKESDAQLHPINMSGLGGDLQNRIFDAHSVNGKITRVLSLNYSGGIFPQSIIIDGIPGDKDTAGRKIFDIQMKSGGTTKLVYDAASNKYILTQLDPSAKVQLWFIFNDDVSDRTLNIKYSLLYYDAKTAQQKTMETYQDVGIRTVNQKGDLSLNGVVINKGASGIVVNADTAGTGDKIFIGGNVSNSYESRAGNNLVFTGGGDDTINISDVASKKNVIYGSTGYDFITGTGKTENGQGIDWLIYSNDKAYNNNFMTSDVIKDSYYKTMKEGLANKFYFGVNKSDVLPLWDKLGAVNVPDSFKQKYSSNFSYNYNGITVIGDRNGSISISNIVGTQEVDVFNLYFQGVEQKVKIWGGNTSPSSLGDHIILNGLAGDTIKIVVGKGDLSSITSTNYSNTAYTFDTKSFDRITGGNEDNYFEISYDGGKQYRSTAVYYDGGKGSNTADFSNLIFSQAAGFITFDVNPAYSILTYNSVEGKSIDYFYNFNKIIGSKGHDIFYGHSSSNAYNFDGGEGSNTLSYERSSGGVTYHAINNKVYKVNNVGIIDHNLYNSKADIFNNVDTIKLSNLDDVVVSAYNVNIGSSAFPKLHLGDGNDTIRYDLDDKITHIEVNADALTISKNGDTSKTDVFLKGEGHGKVSFIGTAGNDLFNGGIKYSNSFDGKGGNNNILNYSAVTIGLLINLKEASVAKAGRTDSYQNIQNIVGGSGDDTFSVGAFDPTSEADRNRIHGISVDGGGGEKNAFQFSDTIRTNLAQKEYTLTFDVDGHKAIFKSKDSTTIELTIDITKNIQAIYGTTGNDLFKASADVNFAFYGVSFDSANLDSSKGIYGDTLDYSKVSSDLTINLMQRVVNKGDNKKDTFSDIQAFIGGTGNDTFIIAYSQGEPHRHFDGNNGNNTLNYEHLPRSLTFDLIAGEVKGSINFNDTFRNINTINGGSGNDTFILSFAPNSFNDKSDKNNLTVDGRSGSNTLDFSHWGVSLGTDNDPFELKTAGDISNGKSNDEAIKYNWSNINSFIGSKNADHFKISNANESFVLDGNENSTGDNTLDYSGLQAESHVDLNLSTGVASKYISGQNSSFNIDTIKNIQEIILTNKDDIVRFVDNGNLNLKTLKQIDGKGGNNSIDFSYYSKDISARITANKIDLGGDFSVALNGFATTVSSRGNSTYIVDDNSAGASVTLIGNPAILTGKSSTVDLSALGNFTYWNLTKLDNKLDSIGQLTWDGGNKQAHIITDMITTIKLGNGNNTIYGSNYNHTSYQGGSGENTLRYDYDEFQDSLTIVIDSDIQHVYFNAQGGYDSYKNFKNIVGSKQDDIFEIHNLAKLDNGVHYDGGAGVNTLDFSKAEEQVDVDISKEDIEIGGKKIQIAKIQKLVLTKKDDTVNISDVKAFLFNQIDGAGGNNKINITTNTAVVFNKENDENQDNRLSFGQGNASIIALNFNTIQTTATTNNIFYGSFLNDITYKVTAAAADANHNFLTYSRSISGVEIDFAAAEVNKGGNKKDHFVGINYFYGSNYADIFYLSKTLDTNGNFSTIYINQGGNDLGINAPTGNNDIISIIKVTANSGSEVVFDVAARTIESSNINYAWSNIGTINFTDNQKIIVSFDESYKYGWINTTNNPNATANATTLVFSTKGKNNASYDNGYVVIDVSLPGEHSAITYKSDNNQGGTNSFSGVTTIIGTGSAKDMFFAGLDKINYFGGVTSGEATLSYAKYSSQSGITITFAADNSAKIYDTGISAVKDTAKYIKKFIGTTGNDIFIIADNSASNGNNSGITIEVDGGGGIFDKVDISQTAKGAITLETENGISSYNYKFANINAFKLTDYDDTVVGSLSNKGFVTEGSAQSYADVTIDGGGGNNTLDYSKMEAADGHQNEVNADLNTGTITKTGYFNNNLITTHDTVAIAEGNGSAKINFTNILLNGKNTSNTVTISNGHNNATDIYISVVVNTPTANIIQFINFEHVEAQINLTWNNDHQEARINSTSIQYGGFNSIVLGKGDDTLIIQDPKGLVVSNNNIGGTISGGEGSNTIRIQHSDPSYKVLINLNTGSINFNIKATEYIYSIANFQTIYLEYAENTIMGTDFGNYNIYFSATAAKNEIDYSLLGGSYTNVSIDNVTANGAELTVNKTSIARREGSQNVDKVYNIKDIKLTSNDDIVEIKNNTSTNVTINIDGGRGSNTISFEKNWSGKVPATINADKIEVERYSLQNFKNLVLSSGNDEINLDGASSTHIDGGAGDNKVSYNQGNFLEGISIIESLGRTPAGVTAIQAQVTKQAQGSSSQAIDTLYRFNQFSLVNNKNNTYTATVATKIVNNPSQFTIDFNTTNISTSNNIMDYARLAVESGTTLVGIDVRVEYKPVNSNNTNMADVTRQKGVSNSIRDTLIGVNTIRGTGHGDLFNIDTGVVNLTIDAGITNEGRLDLTYKEVGAAPNKFEFDLNEKTVSKVIGGSSTTFLTFQGIKQLSGVASNNIKIDNTFLIYNFNISYTIDLTATHWDGNTSIYTVDFSNISLGNAMRVDITQLTSKGFNLDGYAVSSPSNKITANGITKIVGNKNTQNQFKLTLSSISSDTNRTYTIEGRGVGGGNERDTIIITGELGGSTINYAAKSNGGLLLNSNNYLKVNIINIPLVQFAGAGIHTIAFDTDSTGSNFYFDRDKDAANLQIVLDFNKLVANDYILNLTSTIISIGSVSKKVAVESNIIDKIILSSNTTEARAIVGDIDVGKEATFTYFNDIDLSSRVTAENQFFIKQEGTNIRFSMGKLNFDNNKDIKVTMGAQQASRTININMQGIVKSVNILAKDTVYNFKSDVTVSNVSGIMQFNFASGSDTSFKNQSATNTFNIQNVKLATFKNIANTQAEWHINFGSSFNYFVGGRQGESLGFGLNINANKMVLDFSSFGASMVKMQASGRNRDSYSDGFYIGVNGLQPNWATVANVSLFNETNGNLFLDTTIITPQSGIAFEITKGWLMSYFNTATSNGNVIKKGVTIDASGANSSSSIVLSYAEDVTTGYIGHTFYYDIKIGTAGSNLGQTNYTLTQVNNTAGAVVAKDINFNLINVSQVNSARGVNYTYTVYQPTNLNLIGSEGNTINTLKFAAGTNFGNKGIDVFYQGSTNNPDNLTGNIGGFQANLLGFRVFDFSQINISPNTVVSFKFDIFPNIAKNNNNIINFLLPEGPTGALDQSQIPKRQLDLTQMALKPGPNYLVKIAADGKIDFWNKSSGEGLNAQPTEDSNHFTAKGFYNITMYAQFGTMIQADKDHSYNLYGGSYIIDSAYRSEISYVSGIVSSSTTNTVTKKNGRDYISGFKALHVNNSDSDNFAVYYSNNNKQYTGSLEFLKVTGGNVYLSVLGFKDSDNRTSIIIDDIQNLNIAGTGTRTGVDHYRVFFIDNNVYLGIKGNENHFDTSGYYALVDTSTNRTIYVSGENIKKYAYAFEEFLKHNGKYSIENVNNYQDMLDALDGNTINTNPYYNHNSNNDESSDAYSNSTIGQNTNHAQKRSVDDDEYNNNAVIKDDLNSVHQDMPNEQQEKTYSSNVENKVNDRNTDNSTQNKTNNDNSYQESNTGFEADYELGVNTNSASSNKNNSNEASHSTVSSSLNIIEIDDNSYGSHNDVIDPKDILDFSNKEDLDYISNSVYKDLTSKEESSEDTEEETSSVINSINSISNTECKDYLEVTPVFYDSSDSNDPTAKVEDSIQRQNSINGNNNR